MKHTYTRLAFTALIILIIAGFTVSQTKLGAKLMGQVTHDHHTDTHANHMAPEQEGKTGVQGITEKAFIEHMIPHHQEAVDTSKEVLARGENAEVKALAESIIVAQEKEIADMKAWYETWYGTPYVDTKTYEPMMRDLSVLEGNALDKVYTEDMIVHHTHALMMNQQVVPNLSKPEMKALVAAIAETQSAEIVTMRILLKQL